MTNICPIRSKPVPFLPRPVDMRWRRRWKTWLVHDQRFVDGRPDVITYQTPPARQARLHIMGAPEVDLFAATSARDSDWVVKLIDVYPNEAPESRPSRARHVGVSSCRSGIEIFRPAAIVDNFAKPPRPQGPASTEH